MNNQKHPVGISHFADGQIPNQTSPKPSDTEEQLYLQPEVEVQEVAKGALVKDDRKKSLCQRIADQKSLPGVSEWFQRNKGIIGWIGIGYLTFRILTRRK